MFVLIVDGSHATRLALRGLLEKLEFTVVEAVTGADAIHWLCSGNIAEALFIDMEQMTAGVSGLLHHLWAHGLPSRTKAIGMISSRAPERIGLIRELGLSDYLVKPFAAEELYMLMAASGGRRPVTISN